MRHASADSPELSPRSALPVAIGLLAVLVFVLHALNYGYFFVDDEGIPYVTAQNIVNGHGVVYNPSDGHVEGYTDFLHVWLAAAILAAVRAIGASKIAVFFVGKVISLACGVAIVWLVPRLLERLGLTRGPSLLAGIGFLVLAGPLAAWSLTSLETIPFALLVLLFAYALCDDSGSTASDRIAAIAAILVVLERLDGLLYVGALAVAFVLVGTPERRRAVLRVVLPAAVVIVVYNAWRLAYYHALLTPAIASKVLFKLRFAGRMVVRVQEQNYAVRFFDTVLWIPAAALVLALILARRRERAILALAVAIGLLTVYIAIVGDWMFGYRFFAALIPFYAILIAWLVSRIPRRRTAVSWALAAIIVVISGRAAYAFERAYEAYQWRPSWLLHPRGPVSAYFPFYELQETIRQRLKRGETMATNLGGFVPFMVGAPNIDNLGLCSPVFSELPTADVIFTEVGRYSPMTSKPVLRAADAYLLYRAPALIAEPGTWIMSANGGHTPPTIFGGRYRFVAREDGGRTPPEYPWRLYERDAPLEEFHYRPELFLENLVHPSAIAALRVNGRLAPSGSFLRDYPYLHEDEGRFAVVGRYDLEMQFGHPDEPVYELFIDRLTVSAPARLTFALSDAEGVRYEKQFDLAPGHPLTWFERLGTPVRGSSARLAFSATTKAPVDVALNDVRVQGQSPALSTFITRTLVFEHASRPSRP